MPPARRGAAIAVMEQLPAPQRITEEEVRAIAAAEGLVLVPAPGSSTGYKGVTRSGCGGKPFKAQARQDGGGKKNLGNYATAAEASLAYVRHVGPEVCAFEAWRATTTAIPAPSSEPEQAALQLAATEGLVLEAAPGTATGYKGVTQTGVRGSFKPFKAQVRQVGCLGKSIKKNLGCYGTAAEAALAYARHLSTTTALAALPALTLHAPPPIPGGQAQGHAGSAQAAEPLLEAHAEPMPPMPPPMLPMHLEPTHAARMHAARMHAAPARAHAEPSRAEPAHVELALLEAAASMAEVMLPGVPVAEVMHLGDVMHAMLDASGRLEGEGMG
jgi:hypothetical protein